MYVLSIQDIKKNFLFVIIVDINFLSVMADNNTVPIKSIPQSERIDSMRKQFTDIYLEQPEWFVRVPGR